MKEKRLLAVFITSAVTLITSLAVTFGVVMTLADPVVATGVTRYQYSFNQANNSLISVSGKTLKLKEDILFQPSSSIVWSDNDGEQSIWFNGSTYEDEIVYADESISTRLKVVPFRVTNSFSTLIQIKVDVSYDKSTMLGKYTYVKVYDYKTNTFNTYSSAFFVDLPAGTYRDYAIVVCVDDSMNTSTRTISWGSDYETINVSITNQTIS